MCAIRPVVLTIAVFGICTYSAHLVVAQTRADEPLVPKPLFADDFQTDSRSDYTIKGDVAWKLGRLVIPAGGSARRERNAGSWAEVKLDLEFSELKDDGEQSRTELRFSRYGASDCGVAWLQSHKDSKATCWPSISKTVGPRW